MSIHGAIALPWVWTLHSTWPFLLQTCSMNWLKGNETCEHVQENAGNHGLYCFLLPGKHVRVSCKMSHDFP